MSSAASASFSSPAPTTTITTIPFPPGWFLAWVDDPDTLPTKEEEEREREKKGERGVKLAIWKLTRKCK